MSPFLIYAFFALFGAALAERPYVDPEYLNMLRATGQDEEFARLMGMDVSLVRPQEGRSEEDLMFTTVSELGDILLTPEQEEQARQGISFTRYPRSRWSNNQIPYEFSKDFVESEKSTIRSAIGNFNSKCRNLKIVPRQGQADYVYLISGNGCYSNLGRVGGQQSISLQKNGCLNPGTIQHEFIHAAGFTHEHNRPDRDNNVRVLRENIPEGWRSQYNKVSDQQFNNQDVYDFYSVMHYPMRAPETNKPAFEILKSNVDTRRIGQRSGPSDTDIRKVDILYS